MASNVTSLQSRDRQPVQSDLLLRETNHRCSNDLQLVVSLLSLEGRRAENPEVREALGGILKRIATLARARVALSRERQPSLGAALQEVCYALQAQAEPRSILISVRAHDETYGLSASQITTVAFVVNELTTNAINQGFEEGSTGKITISVAQNGRHVIIVVDADGLSLASSNGSGEKPGTALRES